MTNIRARSILLFALCLPLLALSASCGGLGIASSSAPNLVGTTWTLALLNGQPPVPGSDVTLHFAPGGGARPFDGSAGCNHYGGMYTVNGNQLTFGEIQATAMACDRNDLMQQESAYLKALQQVASYRAESKQLLLSDSQGSSLIIMH